jgi:O-acetyl-ADP-ribose deacetylase (regulator of RNase III)
MVRSAEGDLLKDDSEAIVNPVNCVGVMGRGLALQFRKAFPQNYLAYKKACAREEVQPGQMFVFELQSLQIPRFIVNFPTKRHWRDKSLVEDIDSGLQALRSMLIEKKIQSIALPPLGCGLGGLDWIHVRPRIVSALGSLEAVQVTLYEPI